MNEKEIEKAAEGFVEYWSKYLAISPVLVLDYSWPSVGVVDLLTFSTRFKKELPKDLNEMLTSVSCYLAMIAKKCFTNSVDEVSLFAKEDGVEIKLVMGGSETFVKLEQLLRDRLRILPNPFPVTTDFKAPITFEAPIISNFLIGILAAKAPDVDWSGLESRRDKIIENTKKYLANTCSEYYASLFKKQNIGHLAEFYLNDLIYPVMLMQEELPMLGSIEKVLDYFEEYKITKQAALEIGLNLSVNPDHLLSNLGLILTCALSSKIPAQQVIACAQRKGSYVVFLRRAVKKVREFYGVKKDWMSEGLSSDAMYEQFLVEKSLKFLPWLTLSVDRLEKDLKEKIILPIVIRVCEYDFEYAIKLCDIHLATQPEDSEVLIQLIRLEMLSGNAQRVDKLITDLMSATKVDKLPAYYKLMASVAMSKKDFSRAYNYYNAGINLEHRDLQTLADMQNDAAWCCILMEKKGQALVHLEKALLTSFCPVTILLNKSSILWELGDSKRSLEIREKLFQLSPLDRRVFSNLTLEDAVKS